MNGKWQYFDDNELICHGTGCGCDHCLHMDHDFMVKLVAMRRELGFYFVLSSAYRCPIHNKEVSHTGLTGPHTTGRAVDILADGYKSWRIIESARDHGMTGIGVSQRGPHSKRFIHVDDLPNGDGQPRPWLWSY